MAGITKAQLRFYRQAGVFQPVWRDPENGYFYYDIWQVHHLCMLLLLEHFGYTIKELDEIFQKDVLSYREMIFNRQVYLDDRISQLQQAVSFVEYDIRRTEHTDAYDDEQLYTMEMPPQEIVTTMLERDCDRFDEMAHEGDAAPYGAVRQLQRLPLLSSLGHHEPPLPLRRRIPPERLFLPQKVPAHGL